MDGPTGEHPSPEEAGVRIVVAGATGFAGGATLTRLLDDDRGGRDRCCGSTGSG
jgi:nucleoside-diphosphate-sugar epimerase